MSATEIILFIVSIFMIAICLMQSGKSEGASAAITGGNKMNIFSRTKERGVDKILSIITFITAIIFFAVTLLCMLFK